MKTFLILFAPVLLLLAACGQPPPKTPRYRDCPKTLPRPPHLSDGEPAARCPRVLQTVPSGRAAAILRVTYTLECLKGGKPSAAQHYAAAKKVIDDNVQGRPDLFLTTRGNAAPGTGAPNAW